MLPACNRKEDAEPAAQLDAACAAGLEPFKAALSGWQEQRGGQDGAAPSEMPDWLPQLRSLVQAGVPKARGQSAVGGAVPSFCCRSARECETIGNCNVAGAPWEEVPHTSPEKWGCCVRRSCFPSTHALSRLCQQALRGRLWQIFLGMDGKREPGLYEQLVQKALGNTKYGRKVGHILESFHSSSNM